jgi:hypothetical protein
VTHRIEIILPKPHPAQRVLLREGRRFNVTACGRRWGKTLLGVRLLAKQALIGHSPTAWMAPNYKLLDEAWREMKKRLQAVIRVKAEQTKRIELIGGGSIDFWTLEDESSGRGRKYSRIVIDEAAHARHLKDALEMAVMPTLTDYRGDAWFLSTPSGLDYFHELWQRGNPDNPARLPDWRSWRMPTASNPYIQVAEVEAMRALLPERVFRQEYLAEFTTDGAGVFRGGDRIPCCAWEDLADERHAYVIGVDWARHNDFTVFAVLRGDGAMVHIDRFAGIGYELQVGRLKSLWERFGRCPALAEENSMGGPLIERLQRDGINVRPFRTTNASKGEAIEALSLAIEQGRLSLPEDPRMEPLRSELVAFDQERLPSGLIRYGAPSGLHDDCVMALAIAWSALPDDRPFAYQAIAPRRAGGRGY